MSKFRKRPVVIEAVQLLWTTWGEMCEHAGVAELSHGKPQGCYINEKGGASPTPVPLPSHPDGMMGLMIPTLEGLMIARQGDWVIRGVAGELYACKPDIFAATYEAVPVEGG